MSAEPITTLVLAAGGSTRFDDGGVPKQFRTFSHLDRLPMQMWENSVHGLRDARLHLAVRTEHLRHLNPRHRTAVQVVEVESTTGQADTLRQALSYMCETFSAVQRSQDLLVVNCDNGFEPEELGRMVLEARASDAVVVAAEKIASPTAEQFARFSWAMPNRWFTVALEKSAPPVPPHDGFHRALVGAYYFPSIPMLRQALALWCGGTVSEPYISGVLNIMPERKRCHEVETWHDWGTPDALNNYTRRYA